MLHQPGANGSAINHVENTRRHLSLFCSANDRQSDPFGRCHVARVCLEYDWATRCQSSGGIAAGGGESQREIACAEYSDRADTYVVLA